MNLQLHFVLGIANTVRRNLKSTFAKDLKRIGGPIMIKMLTIQSPLDPWSMTSFITYLE